jgi:anti-sigma factor RsiW
MNGHLDEQLSAYLDGELEGAELASAESHLASCAECRADLEGLTRVAKRAASLDDRPPEKDLWSGIQGRIATPSTRDVVPLSSRRRFAFSMPQLAAAAIALMALSAGTGVVLSKGAQPQLAQGPVSIGPSTVRTVADTAAMDPGAFTAASYDSVIIGMQQMLASRRGTLDTSTIRVVEQSLVVIDLAIKQARAALSRDPGNMYLNGQLQRTLDRKLDVLRRAVTMPAAS